MVDLHLPPGHTAMGAPNPNSVQDASGAWFFGLNTKVSGQNYQFRVYKQVGDGQAVQCMSVQGYEGQGQITLQGDGSLTACAYRKAGDGQTAGSVQVSEFARLSMGGSSIIGGVVPCRPALSSAAFQGQAYTGQQLIDLVALFGLPTLIQSADVRFTVEADAADVRGRLGGDLDPWQLTPIAQIPHLSVSQNGTIYTNDGRNVLLSVVPANAHAKLWLNLLAYTPRN